MSEEIKNILDKACKPMERYLIGVFIFSIFMFLLFGGFSVWSLIYS